MEFIKKKFEWMRNYPHPVWFALMFLPMIIGCRFDTDTWWILNLGDYIAQHGIPTIEPFTIHENLVFYAQQWLSCLIYHFANSTLGFAGVTLVVYAVDIAFILTVYKLCMLVSNKNSGISCIVTFVVSGLINLGFMTARPQVFTLLIIVIELYLLESYVRKNDWRYLIAIPFLSILEINLHASMWLMILVFMAPYIVNSFNIHFKKISIDGYKKIPLILTGIFSIIAGLINPYGFKMMTYLLRSYGDSVINKTVIEMLPTSWANTSGKLSLIFIIAVISLICLNRKHKLNARYVCLILGTTVLALSTMKGVAYFVLGTVFILAYRYQDTKIKWSAMKCEEKDYKMLLCFCLTAVLFVSGIKATLSESNPKIDVQNATKCVLETIDKANQDINQIKVYTNYDDGGYAEYKGLRVYMDARAEVFLKSNNEVDNIYYEYADLMNGFQECDEFLNKYNFDYLIVGSYEQLYHYLNNENNLRNCVERYPECNYTCIYDDDTHQVWAKIVAAK